MGHRIEPYVSIPTKLQTDSTGYNPRVSNSHWLLFPITATIESVRFYVIIQLNTISNLISADNLNYFSLVLE